jgi:hypothetical protein
MPPTTSLYCDGTMEINCYTLGMACPTVERFLAVSKYRHVFGAQAPNDDPVVGS